MKITKIPQSGSNENDNVVDFAFIKLNEALVQHNHILERRKYIFKYKIYHGPLQPWKSQCALSGLKRISNKSKSCGQIYLFSALRYDNAPLFNNQTSLYSRNRFYKYFTHGPFCS